MEIRSRACSGVPAMAGLGWILAALVHAATAAAAPAAGQLFANHVVVRKAAHMLYLYHDKQLLGAYPIELGLDPVGPKRREDDFRTPEGHYLLERRNPRSDYFLSIQISYPNEQDEARAKRHHWAPGDDIMIHGTPNAPRLPGAYYRTQNWTNGCIALSDSNMIEVWMKTKDDTPIDIYP
ncbi:MAG TPA: L,D-transpeptidase family protein [Steroidobacteraceae bacterium]|nr:L,D-transpeptidase family protein [Steroidobacteraceae bacterium]